MKRILLFLLCFATLLWAQAQTFTLDALAYTVTSSENREVSVAANDTGLSGELTIPANVSYEGKVYKVSSIEEHGFEGCRDLTAVFIPNTIESILGAAFCDCSKITSLTIPESVNSIGLFAFLRCESLTEINVDLNNNSYCSINGVLFSKKKDVLVAYPVGKTETHYTIPNSVDSIGACSFTPCIHLTSITIPSTVVSIGYNAFNSCAGLKSLTIPNSVTSIGDWAFCHCRSLTSVIIPNTISLLDWGIFNDCSNLTFVTIPNSVTSIRKDAFSDCTLLTNVTIPNSVKVIEDYAFARSGLKTICINSPEPPAIESNTFPLDNDITAYVPSLLVDTYENSDIWSELNIIGITPPYLANAAALTVLNYAPDTFSGIQFDIEAPSGVELSFNAEASDKMTINTNTIEDGKIRYIAYTKNSQVLDVDFICTATASEATRGELNISNIILSIDDLPVSVDDIKIPVLGYGLDNLTLPDLDEPETLLSIPDDLKDIEDITIAWKPYSCDFGDLYADGHFTATGNGLITDLPLQITDKMVLAPLNATAILNVLFLMGDVDRSGTIDIADVVAVVNYILMRDPDPFDFKRADLDYSGNINIADLTRLVKLVLAQPKAAPAKRHARARSAEGEIHLTVPTTGETVDGKRHVYVHLDTDREYTAMQVDLQTTGGARIASINAGPGIDSHVMDHAAIDPTTTRVLLYSHNLSSLPAGDHIIDVTLADNSTDEAPDAQILATSAISADADGHAYTHSAASANIGDISTGLQSVYPTTMTITTSVGHITVEAPAASTVTITDLQGRTLGTWTGTGSLNLSRGLYIVSATNCRPQKVEIR